MAGITLADAEAKLAVWLTAETKVASGQAYTVDGVSMTRANLREIRETIDYWDKKVQRLDRGGIRVRGMTKV